MKKKQATGWEEISAKHISDLIKGLVTQIYKKQQQTNKKESLKTQPLGNKQLEMDRNAKPMSQASR